MKEKTANDYINGGTRGAAENIGSKLAEETDKRGGKSVALKLADKTMESARKDFGIELAKRIDNPDMGTRVLTNISDDATTKLRSYGSIGSKAGTAGKLLGGGITVGLEVGLGYMEDKAADRSSSKILSNAGVNAGYAVTGIAITEVLVAAGVVSGPIGILTAGIVWGFVTVLTSDLAKDMVNSLE